ncbi:MAG: three component ABC system middle component [Hyphomonas sp.]|uniref:three component ABC system middle component n=1 Tax=Hyphomonas sp. TaxID=87 RepID=UPI0030016B2E
MSTLSYSHLSEVERVQNPALGATLLCEFGQTYQKNPSADSAHLLAFFLVLPICLHRPTLGLAIQTRPSSGLGKFCEKLSEHREELFAVHERALLLRELTFSSIGFGVEAGLLNIDYKTGHLRALDKKIPAPPDRVAPLFKGANRLGHWFSSLDTTEIFSALKVEA